MSASFNQKLLKLLFPVFRKVETKTHVLSYLFWECTTRCNLNCLHCGSDCSKSSSYEDMPQEDFFKAIDTIREKPDEITVVLTGGEPLLRKDLISIGYKLREKGFRWSIVSNAMLYNETAHNNLLNAGMGALTFSLDGLAENHNWLRNSPKAFACVDKAIDIAVQSKRLNFDIVSCINKRNLNELDAIYNYLIQKKVKTWRLFTIAPIGRAINNKDLALNGDEMLFLMTFIENKRKVNKMELKFSCEGFVGNFENKVRTSYFFCRAGINIASVLIDGSIGACPNINRSFVQGNIYNDNFFDIWQHKFRDYRNKKWNKTGICKDCKAYNKCNGNGFHLRTNKTSDVLMCHYKLIEEGLRNKKF